MVSTVGIIDTIQHLPLGVLEAVIDTNGPYGPGNHILDTWKDGALVRPVNITFGVIVQISGAIAPKLGLQIGFDDGGTVNLDTFELRICQVAALHQLILGTWVASQVVDVFYAPQLLRYVESNPGRIGLYVQPTWHVDLYYLLAL